MIKQVNITDKEKTIKLLNRCKRKDYYALEIKFHNVSLIKLNEVLHENAFCKNDLFASASKLHAAMQPLNTALELSAHELTPEEIYDVIKNLSESKEAYKTRDSRYMIISNTVATCGYYIVAVIETGAALSNKMDANINKLVAVYPKDIELVRRKYKKRATRWPNVDPRLHFRACSFLYPTYIIDN